MPETQTYIERFRELRANVLKTLDGVNASGLNWKPTRKETNSIFILATHILGSERHWLHRVVGGRTIERDREAEFHARGTNVDALRAEFDQVAKTSEEIVAQLSAPEFDAMHETPNYGTVSGRWCLLHMIEHYAEHGGHMRLTRQLWEEQVKKPVLSKAKVEKAKRGKRKVTRGKAKR